MEGILKGHLTIGKRRISNRVLFPLGLLVITLAGIFSPLFDLSHTHSFPGAKLYSQHLFFDGVSDAGGFYAATFCKHWYHRIPIAVGFALGSTYLLIALVG